MPVRFRCSYCNQLLGISRRKIGSVVRCPTCAGQVVVPPRSSEGSEDANSMAPVQISERDLAELPEGEVFVGEASVTGEIPPPAHRQAAKPEGSWGTHAEPEFDVEKIYPSFKKTSRNDPAPGIHLSPKKATWLTAIGIGLLILAFLAGFLVGRIVP